MACALTSILRRFSANPPAGSPSSAAVANTTTNPRRNKKKKRNLFEVAHFLPNWGVGYHMAKTHWTNVSYQITNKDGKHEKAWGLTYKDGLPVPEPKKISGFHKRCWRYVPNPKKTVPEAINPEVQAA